MLRTSAKAVWRVRVVDGIRYRVEYCCRGAGSGTFEVLLTPWLREAVDRSPAADADLVLCAAGVVLDGVRPVPPVVDPETAAGVDPGFVPELRRRLGHEACRAAEPA